MIGGNALECFLYIFSMNAIYALNGFCLFRIPRTRFENRHSPVIPVIIVEREIKYAKRPLGKTNVISEYSLHNN